MGRCAAPHTASGVLEVHLDIAIVKAPHLPPHRFGGTEVAIRIDHKVVIEELCLCG